MSHPLVRTHRETGRKTLFINPVYTIQIEEFNKEESDALLFELYIHMAKEKYIYCVLPNHLVKMITINYFLIL